MTQQNQAKFWMSIQKIIQDRNMLLSRFSMTNTIQITDVTIHSADEGCGTAYLAICGKTEVTEPADAFAMLWFSNLHEIEEWDKQNVDHVSVNNIYDNFFVPHLNYSVQSINVQTIKVEGLIEKIDYHVKPILQYCRSAGNKNEGISMSAFVKVNSNFLSEIDNFTLPFSKDIKNAVTQINEWNQFICFFETDTEFVYFVWGMSC